jgi:dolichol-phosphate mannosyltransferase
MISDGVSGLWPVACRAVRALLVERLMWRLTGPLADLLVYFAAIAVGLGPASSQCASFATALVLAYLPRAAARRPPGPEIPWLLRAATASALVFFLRSGILALVSGWRWPAPAAMPVAALGTAVLLAWGLRAAETPAFWRLGSRAGWPPLALVAMVVAFGLRILYAGRVELLPEETYYWSYARHLDYGYLDHPPMVAWLIAAGRLVLGDGEFGVRVGALVCAAAAAVFMFRLTRNLFGTDAALASVALLQTLPYFFSTGLLMTPDAPLFAAWAGALCCLERALIGGRASAWWGAGVCFGLGLLAKYTIALLGVASLLFMLIDRPSRAWFRRLEPYGAAILAAALFAPVIVWNAQHQWASFAFQTARRLAEHPQFALPKLIGSVIVLLTPTGCAAALFLLGRRRVLEGGPEVSPSEARGWRWLQVSTLTPLAVYAIFSLRHEVKLDWTGAAWLGAVPVLAWGVVRGLPASALGRRIGRSWGPTMIVLLLLYGAGLYDLAIGIPGVGYGSHAELVPVGWRELGQRIASVADAWASREGERPLVVGMDRYAIASELAFYAPDQAEALSNTSSGHLFGQIGLMYEQWFPPASLSGRTLLLVAWHAGELDAPGLADHVERLDPIQEGVLTRGKDVIRRYYYRLAHGYQPLAVR